CSSETSAASPDAVHSPSQQTAIGGLSLSQRQRLRHRDSGGTAIGRGVARPICEPRRASTTAAMSIGHVHLTPQLVAAVRQAADVVAIAEEHTRLTKRGKSTTGLCPLHREKSPSFSVDPER